MQKKKKAQISIDKTSLLIWDVHLCSSSAFVLSPTSTEKLSKIMEKEIIRMFKYYSMTVFCMNVGQLNDSILPVGSVHMRFMYSALHMTLC